MVSPREPGDTDDELRRPLDPATSAAPDRSIGRHGSTLPIASRYERITLAPLEDEASDDHSRDDGDTSHLTRVEYLIDESKSIVSENRSPDLPFRYSINPYRGCVHGCAYCYARPTHEYLGFGPGLDFETRVVVKPDAANLFEKFLRRKNYRCEPITFSGVTDCYQPVERKMQLTRDCLRVADRFGQPVGIVTKNALVTRDIDVLSSMARRGLVHVYLSITTPDTDLARRMEPRTSTPAARFRAVRELSKAGIPVGVLFAPVIPGLNDHAMGDIVQTAARSGATTVRYSILRLPTTVEAVFDDWLRRAVPERRDKVLSQIARYRNGKLNDSSFGNRMRGTGRAADDLSNLFRILRIKYQLTGEMPPAQTHHFKVPPLEDLSGQMTLF